ncbi:MAG: glycoside hydrolase family 13 protein, partial [Bacteroidota bacterium]|nr:glycoside hydrolase family 13 protein [Bacteroidota bacterium]
MKRVILFFFINFIILTTFAQNNNLERVEPPFWWSGMKDNTVQLLVYGENISEYLVNINSDKVDLLKVNKADSPNYLFLDLSINDNSTFEFDIIFKKKGEKKIKYKYNIYQKSATPKGYSSKDLIYLLMPDRFANGDVKNDSQPEMLEKVNRKNKDGRHGGDIQGVIDNIDYFKDLGITTLWLNPVLENNMPDYSYHGYAITDFYKVDARFGTNELYKQMLDEAHKNDLKIIQDVVYNHCGSYHWWVKDLPFDNWFNYDKNFRTSYRGSVVADPYSSDFDKKQFSSGWFVESMPDMNQKNPFLAKYLIQNTIWWVEYLNLDGLRIDTYSYPDKDFSSALTQRLNNEYPKLTLLGETWLQNVPLVAYFQGDSPISDDYNSHLNSVTDFPLFYATKQAFNETEGWTSGLLQIYYVLAQDFLYSKPEDLVIFLDNHDLDRYFTSVGEDMRKFKMGIAFLLTSRGIPVIYYGTEIAMDGIEHKGHGFIRNDFPGGWRNDTINIFSQTNMSEIQQDAFTFVSKLANWRKTNKAATDGKLLHFLPHDNVYVYFRYTDDEAVMVLLNN